MSRLSLLAGSLIKFRDRNLSVQSFRKLSLFSCARRQNTFQIRSGLRFLSSSDKDEDKSPEDVRVSILEHSLYHVHTLGWTEDALSRGCIDCGLPATMHTAIKRGPVELVEYFLDKRKEHTMNNHRVASTSINSSGEESDDSMKVTALSEAIEEHTLYLSPYITTWPQAVALLIAPQNLEHSFQKAIQIADDFCHLAEVRTSRMDWYSERIMLTCIFCSAEVYMLTDESNNYSDTRDYIQRMVRLGSCADSNYASLFTKRKVIDFISSYFGSRQQRHAPNSGS